MQNPYQSPELRSYDLEEGASSALLPLEQDAVTPQQRVDALLAEGVVFSVMWVLGAGSGVAIFLALRAHRILRESETPLTGLAWVWWCYLVGGAGVLLALLLLFFTMSAAIGASG